MALKVMKTRDGIALSGPLPPGIADAPEMEIFALRDGFYLLSLKGAIGAPQNAEKMEKKIDSRLSESEKNLVRKLLAVKFESRTPAEIAKALSKDEKTVLEALMKKRAVQVFHGGKYEKTGVYNVSDAAFFAVREPSPQASQAQAPAQQADSAPPASSHIHLEKFGWMVLDTEADARNFANGFPEKIKSGDVRGVRAFDRKYYFVRKDFVEGWEKKVQLSLGKSEKDEVEIGKEVGLPPGGVRALLYHLCENGEVMERKRGKFARA